MVFTHTNLRQNGRPRTPYLGLWYSCRFLAWHLTPSRCSVPVGRRSRRNSSATSIVTLVHQRVSWRGRYDWYRKPDFHRWMISGPPIRFAGACWHPPAPPPPHPNTGFVFYRWSGDKFREILPWKHCDGAEHIRTPVCHHMSV